MSELVHVAKAGEIAPNERKIVETEIGKVGVINYEGELYAVHGTCPHQGGPVCDGLVRGQLLAEWDTIGEWPEEDVDDDSPTISCPWHGWEFELQSGRHVGDDDARVPTFEVVTEDGDVYVKL